MNRVEQPRHRRPALPFYLLTVLALLLAQGQASRALARQWETNGNNINNTNTGNVGVGTTTPTSPLEVQAPNSSITLSQAGVAGKVTIQAAIGRDLHLNANARWSGAAWERFDTTAPSWNFYGSSVSDHFGIRRAAAGSGAIGWTDVFRITNTGNVGIGTVNPSHKLEVAGSGGFIGPGAAVGVRNTDGWTQIIAGQTANAQAAFIATPSTAYSPNTPYWAMGLSPGGGPGWSLDTYDGTEIMTRVRVMPITGNVGIGILAPAHKLDVAGNVNASGGLCIAGDCKTSWSQVGGGASQWTTSGSNVFFNSGNVGIGTATPTALLDVRVFSAGAVISRIQNSDTSGTGTAIMHIANGGNNIRGGRIEWTDTQFWVASIAADRTTGITLRTGNATSGAGGEAGLSDRLVIRPTGNVGIGILAPAHKLDVAGNVNASGGLCIAGDCKTSWSQLEGTSQWTTSGSNIHYSNGNVGIGTTAPAEKLHVVGNIHVTGNINAKYQDVAEWVPSTQKLAAGTVVVLDTTRSNHVVASSTAYDTRVAGVVSAQPGVLLGEGGEGRLMVATTGRVRVKVDATRGPIRVGDLLVTSDVEGVAMKSEPVPVGGRPMHLPGTLIGKALEPLESGVREILVLLSLQ
jgi:hypothetical protein